MSYIKSPNTGGSSSVKSDGVTIQGDGSVVDPIAILQVKTDSSISGDGTVANPLAVSPSKPYSFAYDNVELIAPVGPFTVPFTAFPALDTGDWVETISSGDWDIASGGLRCFKDGVYKITGQMTLQLGDLVAGNTEIIIQGGLVLTIDPSLPMFCQGYIHANIESNTTWAHTLHFSIISFVAAGTIYYPFLNAVGDVADLLLIGDTSSKFCVEEVAQ